MIAAGIRDDSRSERKETPVGIGAHRQRDRHRVALDVVLRRFRARQHGLDGSAQQLRGERRLRLDRQLLLRAERAAARAQRDLDLRGIQLQHLGDLLVVVQRALALRVHLDAVSLRRHEARFRLEKGDVDGLRSKRRFDDVRGPGERGIDVAA